MNTERNKHEKQIILVRIRLIYIDIYTKTAIYIYTYTTMTRTVDRHTMAYYGDSYDYALLSSSFYDFSMLFSRFSTILGLTKPWPCVATQQRQPVARRALSVSFQMWR